MEKFDYDLNKYLSYRKATRDEETKDRLDSAIEELKHKEIKLNGYKEFLLSDNAKRMIHDLEKHINDDAFDSFVYSISDSYMQDNLERGLENEEIMHV